MAVAALVLYLIWFVLAFGVRTVVSFHRTGNHGAGGRCPALAPPEGTR